jgi:hypothetical protein
MKTAVQKFVEEMTKAFDAYYRQRLSESVKRGLRAKKLSTRAKLPCKPM